jgi:cephalosporin-C deacetylase
MSQLLPDPPEGFESFWNETVEEARLAPLDYHRGLKNAYDWPGFLVERLEFRGVLGQTLQGWISYPEGARRLPSFLWIPPYGRESALPNEYGTREGFTSLSFNFHGNDAFHQEKYESSRGYFGEGAEEPKTWIFRRMFQDAYIAMRVLQAQPEADENRLATMGLSQGGGMSIWLGAFCPLVRVVCADFPFLANVNNSLQNSVYRYPLKEIKDYMETVPVGEQRVLYTLPFFDTLNLATRCAVPTLVSLGLRDPACKPDTVRAVYEALPGKKELVTYDWGHDWHPDMVRNNRGWLMENLG